MLDALSTTTDTSAPTPTTTTTTANHPSSPFGALKLAWLLDEYGAAEEHARFVEVALLFAAVLAFPDQVGYPSAWDRDGVSNCVAFLRAGGHKAILKSAAAIDQH